MPDPLMAFLENPTGETFAQLRGVVVDAPDYDFYANDLDEMEHLVAEGQFDVAAGRLTLTMPNWLLSPRMHRLVGRAARESGDAELANRESYLVKACLRGLAQSGDGTAGRPYLVTHVSDEYDLLEALNKEPAQQRQATNEQGVFDVIDCTDGAELWFDVSPSVKTHSLG